MFPNTTVQTCSVQLVRHSLRYVPCRQYDAVVKDLKPIYTTIDADHAFVLAEVGAATALIGPAWRASWEYVIDALQTL